MSEGEKSSYKCHLLTDQPPADTSASPVFIPLKNTSLEENTLSVFANISRFVFVLQRNCRVCSTDLRSVSLPNNTKNSCFLLFLFIYFRLEY